MPCLQSAVKSEDYKPGCRITVGVSVKARRSPWSHESILRTIEGRCPQDVVMNQDVLGECSLAGGGTWWDVVGVLRWGSTCQEEGTAKAM